MYGIVVAWRADPQSPVSIRGDVANVCSYFHGSFQREALLVDYAQSVIVPVSHPAGIGHIDFPVQYCNVFRLITDFNSPGYGKAVYVDPVDHSRPVPVIRNISCP